MVPIETLDREIEKVSDVSSELSDGFMCGPFTGRTSELVALGAIACPGCGLFIHADRRKVA